MSPRPDPTLGAEICAALRAQAARLGLSLGDEPVWAQADFSERIDPYSQESNWVGIWQGRARYGMVTLFADGRVFAEYQVLQSLPDEPDRYVESVQVWGRPPRLRGDAVIANFPT